MQGTPEAWREWWQNRRRASTAYFQGKDNIVFHTVIWPSMLIGYGDGGEVGAGEAARSCPTTSSRREFLTMEGKQFSTSRGHSIYVRDFLERYDPDPLRYYLIAAGPETQDTDFTWAEFVRRNNDELVANWGNLVNRTLTNAHRTVRRGARAGRADAEDQARCSPASTPASTRSARTSRPARFRAALGEAMRLAVDRQPVRQRPGAVGAREDRPRARRAPCSTSRCARSTA